MKGSVRKRFLKRTFAFISALSMTGSYLQTIGTFNNISYNIVSANATNDINNDYTVSENDEKFSRIDIEISNQLYLKNDVECAVNVYRVNADGSKTDVLSDRRIKVGGDKNSSTIVSTDYIANGTYTIEVNAPGFKKFSQTVSNFDNMVCTVKVTLGFQHGYNYTDVYMTDENGNPVLNPDGVPVLEHGEDSHPGVLVIGDVNGDGNIDNTDKDILLEAIDYSVRNNGAFKYSENELLICDLNYDGKINLADLTFFTKGYIENAGWGTVASVTKVVSDKYKTASVKSEKVLEGTVSSGAKITDLFKIPNTSDDTSTTDPNGEEVSEPAPTEVILEPAPQPVVDEDGNAVVDENGEPVMAVPEISEENPVGVTLDLDGTSLSGMSFGTNASSGTFEIQLSDDEVMTFPFQEDVEYLSESNVTVSIDKDGNISLDLGNQIAVKKITLKITKVKDTKLAHIGTVEFLNGMEERIPEPAIDYPLNVKFVQDLKVGDKEAKVTATWDPCLSVEGYEFEVSTSSATKADGSFSSTIPGVQNTMVSEPTFSLQSEHGNFKLIKINTTYYVHVRSVTDDYRSAWSDYAKVTTVPNSKPDKPDYVKAAGGYQSLKVSWGADNTNTTAGYRIYYRKIDDSIGGTTTDTYTEINVGKTTSYLITGLEDLTQYEVYVIGYNEKGDSPKSVPASDKTTTSVAVKMINYNVINCDDEGNAGSAHIVSVTRNGGEMKGNVTDDLIKEKRDEALKATYKNNAEKNAALAKIPLTAWGAVDGDASSYYSKGTWDDGGFNALGGNGITFEFDNEYEIGSVAVSAPFEKTNYFYTRVRYWDANGKEYNIDSFGGTSQKKDVNGKVYYIVTFPRKINAKKVQIGFANYWWDQTPVSISEIYFYSYDYTMDDIMNLYVDTLHTVLRDDVTQETIDKLRERINAPDKRTGEFNPNKAALERELATAEKILNAEQISKPVLIHNGITTQDPIEKGTSRRYGGLNAWQPLGVSIGVNTEVTIYVGSPTKKTGDSTELRLVCTQYNSESNGLTLNGANLKVGANTFQLTVGNIAGAEAGGALYIQYQGASDSKVQYSVRVTGGSEVPILDLYKVTDRNERVRRAAEYINALDEYVAHMEEEHNKVHKGATYNGKRNTKLDYDYNKATCILGATDILYDKMMFSIPAPQVLAGLGKGTAEQRAETLITSMDSMEDMMKLFYQHKGMSEDAKNVVDRIPNQHLNIRYQRMFSGAAMYAAGNHIGIQWGTASGMVNSKSVKSDADGRYISGGYFGWGIAHEIGHCINDSSYVAAEITNNYFSILAQSKDTNQSTTLNYDNIFKKTTSSLKGNAIQKTQLGMYWQLHIAYDEPYNFKTYDTNTEIFNNLFYARMDTYSRTPSKAPAPNGIALKLSGGTEQQVMRLACAASEKNVLEFFERWGKTPDSETKSYASQFAKETRAIMYTNDDSRIYAMNGKSSLADDGSTSVINDVKVSVGKGTQANKVTITIDVSDKINSKDILGYEIIRYTISGGDVKATPIGFTRSPKYTDTVTSLNNRTVSYRVTLIDQYLNRSEAFTTDMVKIQHDGTLDKTNWNISTSNLSAEAIVHEATEELPCSHTIIDPATDAVDDNLETVYAPKVTNKTAEIVMNFNQSLVVTGMKYTAGSKENSVGQYAIYVKNDAENSWLKVAEGSFDGSGIAYFANADNKYISTYETTAVKLEILNQNNKNISIAELDVLGVTGDNVDFRKDGETAEAAFGILSADYKYGTREEDFIPEGSLIFTGSYKGNPAYNAVILYDENGNIVGGNGVDDDGKAQQIILADVPDGSLITDVSNGTWVYWINPEDISNMIWPEKVRVELYRVNDALTNEGQRIVSDSLFETVSPENKMSSISIGGIRKYTTEVTAETEATGKE